jgi:HEAT repeat protein
MSSSEDNQSQAELLNVLRTGSPQAQEEALVRLAAVGEAEALDGVVEYLRGQPSGGSEAALDTLRVLANKFVPMDRYGLAEVVIPYLSSGDWTQRLGAVRLLNAHPNEMAIGPLRALITETREKAAEERTNRYSTLRVVVERCLGEGILALASCGRMEVLPDILMFLDDPNLRPVATRAVGVIGSEPDRIRLEDLAEDDDVRVRDSAQWALGLMDERSEQFQRPPDQIPEPPPDRLTPVYWGHRQLEASDESLFQFLIVRVAIEHLLLDGLLSDGRVPETCMISIRRYEGDTPPEFRSNNAPISAAWKYHAQGPELESVALPETSKPPPLPRPGMPMGRTSHITISYPASLDAGEDGLVSFDCVFEPFFGRGWIYQITRQDSEWKFLLIRRTWTT